MEKMTVAKIKERNKMRGGNDDYCQGFLACWEAMAPVIEALNKILNGKHNPIYKSEDCTIGECDCFFRFSKEALEKVMEVEGA